MPDFHRTVTNALMQAIRESIVSGTYAPGNHLRLDELAAKYEVSTMPIREALRALEAEGIVTNIPHRGTFVTQFTAAELDDIYEIRAALEQMATLAAVPNLNAETINELQQLIEMGHSDQYNVAQLVQMNTDFHTRLYETSGRKHLCDLILILRHRTHHYLHAYVTELKRFGRAQEEHQAIVDACKSGDAQKAADLMYAHVRQVGQSLADYIRSRTA